jgi:hypothetical protein
VQINNMVNMQHHIGREMGALSHGHGGPGFPHAQQFHASMVAAREGLQWNTSQHGLAAQEQGLLARQALDRQFVQSHGGDMNALARQQAEQYAAAQQTWHAHQLKLQADFRAEQAQLHAHHANNGIAIVRQHQAQYNAAIERQHIAHDAEAHHQQVSHDAAVHQQEHAMSHPHGPHAALEHGLNDMHHGPHVAGADGAMLHAHGVPGLDMGDLHAMHVPGMDMHMGMGMHMGVGVH